MTINPYMPRTFGAHPQPDGSVIFSYWRPDLVGSAHGGPALVLTEKGEEIPMKHAGEGFWQAQTTKAGIGDAYQYRAYNTGGDFEAVVPDPASHYQKDGSYGPSVVTDPDSYEWQCNNWKGRPQHELVMREIHIGTFTKEGTFRAASDHLDEMRELGVTGIWLNPVAERPGGKDGYSWGYDGTLWYAPANAYGEPDDLKAFIDACHEHGISIFLDCVYNHFGPDGNGAWGTPLVDKDHKTPWGNIIRFEDEPVRQFAIRNAQRWLNEFRFDGLRLDAIHGILPKKATREDNGQEVDFYGAGEAEDFYDQFSHEVLESVDPERNVVIIVENEQNWRAWLDRNPQDWEETKFHAAICDDLHHALHVLVTGETFNYYEKYGKAPIATVAHCLAEGMAFNIEDSKRNEETTAKDRNGIFDPATTVNFLQNHDQIGNRAFGERLRTLLQDNPEGGKIMSSLRRLLYLNPTIPCDFQGEEYGATTPHQFFCSFQDENCRAGVVNGRRDEFANDPNFADPRIRETIPNPLEWQTFENSKLQRPDDIRANPVWQETRTLIAERNEKITPHLESGLADINCAYDEDTKVIDIEYTFHDGAVVRLTANLSNIPAAPLLDDMGIGTTAAFGGAAQTLQPWSVNTEVTKKAAPDILPTPGAIPTIRPKPS